jgi:shikimate dehydrogenase
LMTAMTFAGMPGVPVVVGLLGAGIQLSRTPRMHEVEGARLGLRYVYKLLDTDTPVFEGKDVAEILWAAEACGFSGLNVTYPYKQSILPHLDELSANAARLGAVNTVVFRDGKRFGHNTDLSGFAEGFRRNMVGAEIGHVLQIGAGGAGSAVSRALLQLGVTTLVVSDISLERAHQMVENLAPDFPEASISVAKLSDLQSVHFDGLVNTTPVGMAKSPGMPVTAEFLKPAMWVADIIYFPLETELLATARALGCRTMSGEPMAIFQAVRALELFSGHKPDPDAMKATFNAFATNSETISGDLPVAVI